MSTFFVQVCVLLSVIIPWLYITTNAEPLKVPLKKPDWLGPIEALETSPDSTELESIVYDENKKEYILRWLPEKSKDVETTLWIPHVNLDVIVEARAIPTDSGYIYSYNLTNDLQSAQHMYRFLIHCLVEASATKGSKNGWRLYQLPVNVWDDIYMSWTYESEQHPRGLPPGATVSDLEIQSPGWPGIVECYARGDAPILTTQSELPDAISKALPTGLLTDCVKGKTIGPAPIPEMTPESLGVVLKEMTTFLDDAKTWGWASDKAVEAIQLGWQEVEIAIDQVDLAKIASNLGHFETLFGALEMKKAITNEVSSLYKPRIEWLRQYYAKYKMN